MNKCRSHERSSRLRLNLTWTTWSETIAYLASDGATGRTANIVRFRDEFLHVRIRVMAQQLFLQLRTRCAVPARNSWVSLTVICHWRTNQLLGVCKIGDFGLSNGAPLADMWSLGIMLFIMFHGLVARVERVAGGTGVFLEVMELWGAKVID
ncbi:unnamed protein product [Peronospora belbahrii]|uniref:Protein kinase domain-containing protein n=1 Tax=Peronospora belbahrii TaxID=622444 RepID=A0ABN8CPJ5_9STRA|nr:unnamed protein product [Peronospora belbahrii]